MSSSRHFVMQGELLYCLITCMCRDKARGRHTSTPKYLFIPQYHCSANGIPRGFEHLILRYPLTPPDTREGHECARKRLYKRIFCLLWVSLCMPCWHTVVLHFCQLAVWIWSEAGKMGRIPAADVCIPC